MFLYNSSIIFHFNRLLLGLSCCFLFLALDSIFYSVPSLAAEKIVVRYGIFEQSLPVSDLRQYAETQKVSSDLQGFLRYLNPQEKLMVQQALQVNMSLDIVALDKLFNSEMGEKFLSSISPAIARRDDAGVPALRAAIILGTNSPKGLGIISFLEAYPSKRIVIDLSETEEVLSQLNLFSSSEEVPPTDNLSSTALWQIEVQYQLLASQGKQYQGCLFGDSITAQLGNSLGDNTFNFALNGLSTISLVEQLKLLSPANVKCQKIIIAIGGNDAWYRISDEVFIKNLKESIALVRTMGTQEIVLIPAFYSTVEASLDPKVAAPLSRVEEINALINQVAATEKLLLESEGIQPLYQNNVLKDNLTSDGDHLNAEGLKIYRQALLKILNSTP